MRILAVDPGHTTGIALLQEDSVLLAMLVSKEIVDTFFAQELYERWKPEIVAIERTPQHSDVDQLTVAIEMTFWLVAEGLRIPVKRISPGTWKPVMGKLTRAKIGDHLRDAIDLGRYAQL